MESIFKIQAPFKISKCQSLLVITELNHCLKIFTFKIPGYIKHFVVSIVFTPLYSYTISAVL